MNAADIANIRLQSQQISGTKFETAREIVSWMGVMQAQDFAMAKWAIGARLPGSTEVQIQAALDKGEIIRTHLLRPTWHFAAAEDVYWMLELSAPQIKALMKFNDRQLELDEKIFKKSNSIISKALEGGKHLTRDVLVEALLKAKIPTNNNRASHLMMRAELEGIVCSGMMEGKKQTYTLLSERVPKTKKISREEAVIKLADRYFSSHFPATLNDFIWWSGLSLTVCRNALEEIKKNFTTEEYAQENYWLPNALSINSVPPSSAFLLPAFDEYLISYKNRTASIRLEHQKKAFTNNGIFHPVIVVDGQVMGTWKRSVKKDAVLIEAGFLQQAPKSAIRLLEKSALSYASFLDKKKEITYSFDETVL